LALSARLEIRQGQGLVITPQLQQAIKLLQLSNIELEAFVDAELERNPLLVRDDRDGEAEPEAVEAAGVDTPTDRIEDAAARADMDVSHDEVSPGERATGDDPGSESAADAGGSVDWSRAGSGGSSFDGDADALESALSRDKTLNEHLHDQLAVAGLSGPALAVLCPLRAAALRQSRDVGLAEQHRPDHLRRRLVRRLGDDRRRPLEARERVAQPIDA